MEGGMNAGLFSPDSQKDLAFARSERTMKIIKDTLVGRIVEKCNMINAKRVRDTKSNHSEFYYKLSDLNEKIQDYFDRVGHTRKDKPKQELLEVPKSPVKKRK